MSLPQVDILLNGFGADYANGTATAYIAGTSTLLTWYTDAAGTNPAANPYTLSSVGAATLYCGSRMKLDVKNSVGVSAPGFPIDNIGFGNIVSPAWVVATAYGATKNDTTISAALAVIGSDSATLYCEPGTWTIANNLTIPTNVVLATDNGTIFSVNSGKTLTIEGAFNPLPVQVFSGSGSVTGLKLSCPEWFGAVGDATTDDTAAVQKAIDSSSELVIIEPTDAYRLTDTIDISKGNTIIGNYCDPYTGTPGTRAQGSWFFIDHLGIGFNIVKALPNSITGVFFERIGTYRDQPAPAVGWSPLAADWDFYISNADVTLKSCVLLNPTKGIKHADETGGVGRLTLDDVVGQPLTQGIEIQKTFDTFRCTNVRFWPYWKDNTNIHTYTLANLVAMKLVRCDNPLLVNFFSIFPKYGIQISSNADGTTVGMNATNIDIDRHGASAIYVDSTTDSANLNITNLKTLAETGVTDTYGILVDGENSILSFTASRIGNSYLNAIKDTSGSAMIRVSGLQVNSWNVANTAQAAIHVIASTRLYVDGSIIYTAGNGAALVNNGAIIRSDEWVSYTPTVTPASGAITTYTATAKYRHSPGLVNYEVDITLTNNGTGTGTMLVTLPVSTDSAVSIGAGKNATSGVGLIGQISGASMTVTKYDGTYPATTGDRLYITGAYSVPIHS